ncbi:hypothetical protein CAL26_24060 [Bordetella genomosp. 9]|uniref:Zinc finger/thioredoxin putative domain-containing protein n=2 Tax=Bordetella genomosp. 9 TaxID=1416803 RepID=A0A261R6B1_9BORD|nr:DUF3426 domain-containing protein [Bordetella genomosp. 9]OZI20568.1 hypothetical protein CAL26_24060 [Bordetella genomosp. 9]
MAMTTRCPHCGTAFKVVADQLRVRNGLVRCGVCSRVFDGLACAVDGQAGEGALPRPAPRADTPVQLPAEVSPVLSVQVPAEPPQALRPYTPPPVPPRPAPVAPARPLVPTSTAAPVPPASHMPTAAPVAAAAVLRGRDSTRRLESDPREPVIAPYVPPVVPHVPRIERPAEPSIEPTFGSSLGPPIETPTSYRHVDDVDDADVDAYDDDHTIDDPTIDSREPYAPVRPGPYRQDDIDDAPLPARDVSRGNRIPIYADRDAVEEDDPDFVSIPGESRTRYDDLTDAGMAPPIFMDEEVQRRRSLLSRVWLAGILVALLVLALQCLYIYRTPIATSMPALRPAMEAICRQVGCQVGYARRLERISITASSLQPQSGVASEDGVMRLTLRVTLRNRFDKPQPWPGLVLQLTDLSDTVVVRKVLLPENYLPPGTQGPFPAGGELSLAVPLQVNGLHVNGYQLDKFFP